MKFLKHKKWQRELGVVFIAVEGSRWIDYKLITSQYVHDFTQSRRSSFYLNM